MLVLPLLLAVFHCGITIAAVNRLDLSPEPIIEPAVAVVETQGALTQGPEEFVWEHVQGDGPPDSDDEDGLWEEVDPVPSRDLLIRSIEQASLRFQSELESQLMDMGLKLEHVLEQLHAAKDKLSGPIPIPVLIYQATRMAEEFKQLERMVRNGNLAHLPGFVLELEALLDRVKDSLQYPLSKRIWGSGFDLNHAREILHLVREFPIYLTVPSAVVYHFVMQLACQTASGAVGGLAWYCAAKATHAVNGVHTADALALFKHGYGAGAASGEKLMLVLETALVANTALLTDACIRVFIEIAKSNPIV